MSSVVCHQTLQIALENCPFSQRGESNSALDEGLVHRIVVWGAALLCEAVHDLKPSLKINIPYNSLLLTIPSWKPRDR